MNLTGTKPRIHSIDILRGAVMIIMALDHVRDFFHVQAMTDSPTNMATTTPVLFFTRWITHYCAPIFVFLSGMSAFISGQQKTKKELGSFLLKRGLWLIIVELVLVSFGLSFNPSYGFILLQVIWAIGWSMIILGLLIRTSYTVILILGILLFFGHNITDYLVLPKDGAASVIWNVLLTTPGSFYPLDSTHIVMVAYAILPWTGIMLLGFSFGALYRNGVATAKRKKIMMGSGLAAIVLFLLLRFINLYGDPSHWATQKDTITTVLSFFNVTKYPPSLLYSCMTIGPALLLLAVMENTTGRLAGFLRIYGRVPFFYYILHFYLIHIVCVLLFYATGYTNAQIVDPQSPFFFRPVSFGFSLPVVYLIWLSIVLALYYPCRWFNRYKQTHRQWWLSYV